jgi:hypothetical protein
MTHTMSLDDEQYARLEAAARTAHTTPDMVLAGLLNWLPATKATISAEQYARRWDDFWNVVGSIQRGQPLTSDEMDEMIGEEIADDHADTTV